MEENTNENQNPEADGEPFPDPEAFRGEGEYPPVNKDPEQKSPEITEEPVKQKLFLLEFIVDDISLDFCNAKQLICYGEGQTVIEFKFLDIGPLRITENDFEPIRKHYLEGCTGTGNIKNGKSILFGLTPEEAEKVTQTAVIYCDIIKKTPTKEFTLGTCMIRIINLFKELLGMVNEGGQSYYHKNIKDCYKIKDINGGDLVGHLFAYLRVSCFNEIIINKFKKDLQEIDYSTQQAAYNYTYNKSEAVSDPPPTPCTCPDNRANDGTCFCPPEVPPANCPQTYTDNKCVFNCPQTLRPCEKCPNICTANKKAGVFRERLTLPQENPKEPKGKAGKTAKGEKKGKSKKGKKK